tara:strand:- start:44 stop:892 length:849 start_codon:yes stop_codon:yes gene_type:complete
MENWRYYNARHDFNILCENHKKGRLNDSQLVELWEIQVNSELESLLSEGLLDILKTGYEKGAQLVGDAKKKYDAALAKVNEWILEKCVQAWQLAQQVKDGLGRVAVVIKTAVSGINKFCAVHPVVCGAAKILLAMIAVAAALALFSSSAHAAVQVQGHGGDSFIVNDMGIDALKGSLEMLGDGGSPEIQQKTVEAFRWLEAAHASETVHDLATSSERGGKICNMMWESLKGMIESEEGMSWRQMANYGEDVVIRSNEYTKSITINGINDFTHVEWESLAVKK